MRVRGHTPRILGNVLLVLGVVLLVARLAAALLGALWAKDALTSAERPPDDLRDLIGGLLVGGNVAAALGFVSLGFGVVLRGVGKALHERALRLDAPAPTQTAP